MGCCGLLGVGDVVLDDALPALDGFASLLCNLRLVVEDGGAAAAAAEVAVKVAAVEVLVVDAVFLRNVVDKK